MSSNCIVYTHLICDIKKHHITCCETLALWNSINSIRITLQYMSSSESDQTWPVWFSLRTQTDANVAHVLCLPSISYCSLCLGRGHINLLTGLAGTSDERHPAAARRGPKSMSSQKHSAGKVLHNQMGFPPLVSALFYTCCQQAHWGFDADTGL